MLVCYSNILLADDLEEEKTTKHRRKGGKKVTRSNSMYSDPPEPKYITIKESPSLVTSPSVRFEEGESAGSQLNVPAPDPTSVSDVAFSVTSGYQPEVTARGDEDAASTVYALFNSLLVGLILV